MLLPVAVEEDRQTQTRQLEARLSALEDKLATQAERNTAADVYNAEDSIAAGHCTGEPPLTQSTQALHTSTHGRPHLHAR